MKRMSPVILGAIIGAIIGFIVGLVQLPIVLFDYGNDYPIIHQVNALVFALTDSITAFIGVELGPTVDRVFFPVYFLFWVSLGAGGGLLFWRLLSDFVKKCFRR